MNLRIIQGKELQRLNPILEERGWPMPSEQCSIAIIGEENGELCGFAIIQLLPHLEPVWVRTDQRGTGLADSIVTLAAGQLESMNIQHWVSVIRNDQSKRLAESIGMVPSPGEVYVK